jgi:hypothetical protein
MYYNNTIVSNYVWWFAFYIPNQDKTTVILEHAYVKYLKKKRLSHVGGHLGCPINDDHYIRLDNYYRLLG